MRMIKHVYGVIAKESRNKRSNKVEIHNTGHPRFDLCKKNGIHCMSQR